MKIILDDKNGTLLARVDYQLLEVVRGMPGKKRWDNHARPPRLLFEPTEANIVYLREKYPLADWEDTTGQMEIIKQLDDMRRASMEAVLAPAVMPTDYRFKTKPYDAQLRVFMQSRDMPAFALFMEQATGKTKVLIDTAAYLWSKGKINTLLIFAPNGVHQQWVEEQFPRHMPDWVEWEAHVHKDGKPPLSLFDRDSPKLRVLSMNFEAVTREQHFGLCVQFLRSGRALHIIDESHKMKNPQAEIVKRLNLQTRDRVALRNLSSYRRIATGTPIAKGMEDKYTQFYFLDPFIIGLDTYTAFKNNYCVTGGHDGRKIIAYRNLENFQARITPYAFRVLRRDCIDLPEKIGGIDHPDGPLKRYVELTPEQRRHYDALRRDFLTELSDGSVLTAQQIVVRMTRFQQIVCGYLPREDGTLEIIPSNRMAALREIVEDSEGKVVVWCRFNEDVESVCRTFGDRAVDYYGPTKNTKSMPHRVENKNAFINDPAVDMFVSSPAAGGTGLDGLQGAGATTVVYYSNSFSAIDRWQSEDRTQRPGMKFPVAYYDLVARGSIDNAILANLRRKKDIADLTLGELEAIVRGS